MSNNVETVLLVGTGSMAVEYVKVLKGMGIDYTVVGNTEKSVGKFLTMTGDSAYIGGINKYVDEKKDAVPNKAIVAVNGINLYSVTKCLILSGVNNILVEKPGCISFAEIDELEQLAKKHGCDIFIAYNRRFYGSVDTAREIIDDDGGLVACNFEFTEWQHVIEKTSHSDYIKQKWFLMNSSHVVDLVFHIAGEPKEINSYIAGSLDWHEAGCNYVGCGITNKNVLFSYQANWNSPGRWGIEFLTNKHRLYLRPMEQLSVQKIGSVSVENIELKNNIDSVYKPGLYKEVRAFLQGENREKLCTLIQQKRHMKIYKKISGEDY